MEERTRALWAKQDQHQGDRLRLFSAVADAVAAHSVLYAGSYVDIAASFCFRNVTYVDMDKRASRFFADESGVEEIIASQQTYEGEPSIAFVHADYQSGLAFEEESFDLLVSLYAGLVSEACTQYLKIGGTLLVNPSHGDASLASIDQRYELSGVVISRDGGYRVRHDGLGAFFVPKKDQEITVESIKAAGRGVGYTKSAFAYLFRRIA